MTTFLQTCRERYYDCDVDIACAVFWYLNDNHSGQFTQAYKALCVISKIYKPGFIESGPKKYDLSWEIYEQLDLDTAITLANELNQES